MTDAERRLADQVEAYLAGKRRPCKCTIAGDVLLIFGVGLTWDLLADLEIATGKQIESVIPVGVGTLIIWR